MDSSHGLTPSEMIKAAAYQIGLQAIRDTNEKEKAQTDKARASKTDNG